MVLGTAGEMLAENANFHECTVETLVVPVSPEESVNNQ